LLFIHFYYLISFPQPRRTNHTDSFAFFEYCLQVPANRLGFKDSGGPFDIMQLKVIQEVITLAVFTIFSMIAFKMELKWNHLAAFVCLILAVYFVFKK
jgi:uncharacterized protein (DUF486 family)